MNDIAANLATPARWLIVVGIAYTLATSALYFLAPPPGVPQSGSVRPGGDPAARPDTDINAILASNLFGVTDATEVEDSAPLEAAVETRLPLELLGVFVADNDDDSAAIISQRGRQGLLYAIGDSVPGDATLMEVHSDHVILRRAGVRETLFFPSPTESLAIRARTNVVEEPTDYQSYDDHDGPFEEPTEEAAFYGDDTLSSEEPTMGDLIGEYRERLEQDPDGALADLGVAPVAEGAAEGYRVGELADTPYLSQTGLQPGDVILSVNGRPVGDLNQDRMELDNVLAQGSARLEVQRGSRRFFVTAALDR